MSKIVICSSANFYERVVKLETMLTAAGHNVVIPKTARDMKIAGNYTVNKSWYNNPKDYVRKADLMRTHFAEIEHGDMILVANYEKHGQPNYIGPNVLMEMGIGFYFGKSIYILNEIPENTPFEEEIKGFIPTVLHGDVSMII